MIKNIAESREMISFLDTEYQDIRTRTIGMSRRKQNQEIPDLWNRISSLTKCLFYFTNPFSCCTSITVNPNIDVIVKKGVIPVKILRETGIYCCIPGNDIQEINTSNFYITIKNSKINDSQGWPLYIDANVNYHIEDSLSFAYSSQNEVDFIREKLKVVLQQVWSQYDCQKYKKPIVESQLKIALQPFVNTFGIKIDSVQLLQVCYGARMEKILLAKQEAEAYIKAQSNIADGVLGIVESMISSLKTQGIELSLQETNALITDLTFMMTHQGMIPLTIQTGESPILPMTMHKV